ncbi:MAG: LysR family transcriptional regulator [Pseudomonadota bacterium]
MDIASLRLFQRIAQRDAIGQAARDLGLSPATASARLSALEASLGVRLFNRTTRAVSLTSDGAAFLPYAQNALELLDDGVSTVAGAERDPSGRLRMTMSGSFGRMHVLPLLGSFAARYPDISLDLQLSDDMQDLIAGAYDLAIRNAALVDSTLVARKLADDERILVASPSYLAAAGTPQTPSDLIRHRCIINDDKQRWSFTDGTTIKVADHFRINDGEGARLAAEADLGITIKSRWNAYQSLRQGRLVQVLADFPLASDTALWAVMPPGRLMPPKVRVMVDYLVDQFGPEPYWV